MIVRALVVMVFVGLGSVQAAAPPPAFAPKQRSRDELLKSLVAQAAEIDLETVKGTTKKLTTLLQAAVKKDQPLSGRAYDWAGAIRALTAQRPDLVGLPFLSRYDCRAPFFEAREYLADARTLRRYRGKGPLTNTRDQTTIKEEEDFCKKLTTYPVGTGTVPVLEQILQADNRVIRLHLVQMLRKSNGKRATEAMARRAVYDPDDSIRRTALVELQHRDKEDSRDVLLKAIQHPWSPAAEHAALALVKLKDTDALPSLRDILITGDPARPKRLAKPIGKASYSIRELVRVNHLRNCALCHAPCPTTAISTFRAAVPEEGKPLPVGYYPRAGGTAVAFDIIYLRQDFSAMHAVAKPGKWPIIQRFDYLTRERPLTAAEARLLARKEPSIQKRAILWAIDKLEAIDKEKQDDIPVEPPPR